MNVNWNTSEFSGQSTATFTAPIRVTITPLRSAYFAGEVVSVHFSFTNTRSSALPTGPNLTPSFTPSHKRASHSISAAPLSRPPTSPGTPKLASPVTPSFVNDAQQNLQRKGIVGVRSKRRSLSVEVNPSSLEQRRTVVTPLAVPSKTPRITSIHPSHPHARKQSVDIPPTSPSPTLSSTNSVSTFSASLESIAEIVSDETHPVNSPSPVSSQDVHNDLQTPYASRQKHSALGIGKPPRNPVLSQRNSFSANHVSPGTELILYSYAQVQGTLSFDRDLDLGQLQAKLRRPRVVGGGSMDLSLPARSQRSFSFSVPENRSEGENARSQGAKEWKIPTFEIQPTPLFIDLSLSPGETKSYKYAISLPKTLPPTFKGKFFKIDYHLVLGVSRAKSPLDGNIGSRHVSQVMKVPLRLYDNVDVSGLRSPYDLLWPLSSQAGRWQAPVVQECGPSHESKTSPSVLDLDNGTLSGLKMHVASFLRGKVLQDTDTSGPSVRGCREAVELSTRTSRNTSYDVRKNDVHFATLTFVKPGYRLGESVLGVLDLGKRDASTGKVLKFCAFLDTEEIVPECLNTKSHLQSLVSSRTHAEYHTSLLNATTRVSFQLDIPSDSTPSFSLHDSSSPTQPAGFKWKIRILLLVALPTVIEQSAKSRHQMRNLQRGNDQSEWGFSYTASDSINPLQRLGSHRQGTSTVEPGGGWISFLTPSFLRGKDEHAYHDGDEGTDANIPPTTADIDDADAGEGEDDDDSFRWKGKGREGLLEPDGLGDEDEWHKMKLERVECEVPIEVWPGNTAFRPAEVVFEI